MAKSEPGNISRKKKLLLQVGLIVVTIFMAIMVATGWLVYIGAKQIYLQAKNEMIDRDLLRLKETVEKIKFFPWMLDYCEAHPEEMDSALLQNEPISSEEYELIYNFYKEYKVEDTDLETVNTELVKVLRNSSEELQFAMAKDVYQNMLLNFYVAQYQSHYDKMYIIDICEENRGFLFCSVDVDNSEEFDFGKLWDYSIEKHPAIQTLLSGVQGEDYENTVYELAPISDDKIEYYIGYAPVFADGEVRCAICISFDWSEFRDSMMPYILYMFLIGTMIMILSGGILLLFLHISVVRPLRKIQTGVRRYMDDKDTKAVCAAMQQILSKNELGVLSEDISALALEFERYTKENIRLAGEQERVAAELGLAARIQNHMLPKNFPNEPQFDLFASMDPAKEVGGDFYDFFMVDENHLCMVIADVSGKGIPASLFMMMSMIIIRNYARAGKTPDEVLRKTNRSICENNDDSMFVTAWLGILELSTGHVVAANAGHEYPLLRKPDGGFELFKDKHGFVLGAMPGMKYKAYEFDIEKGGTLFVYTDGAPEATDAKEELFGTDRMLEALNRDPDRSPKEQIAAMTEAIDKFVGEAPQFDDLTMLCIRYNG